MVQLPDGVELTLSELQEMASRQQQQIESQQQMLVAKEQRVKFLKQQEQRHQQIAVENERLQRLRERVDAQEAKLQRLRSLRGQVDQQKINNSSLTAELESIRSLFNAKEKELSLAVAKVDQLTKQLEELRKGRLNGVGGLGSLPSAATIELEKLRRELVCRNKLNEQQNNKLAQQREYLTQRTDEMARIDRRVAELQQRLQRKRMLNQQLANQINAAANAKQAQLRVSAGALPVPAGGTTTAGNNHRNTSITRPPFAATNIAAVEPYLHTPVKEAATQDDLHAKVTSAGSDDDLPEFHPNKGDLKYQTLPYNTKFGGGVGKFNGGFNGGENGLAEKVNGLADAPDAKRPVEEKPPSSGTFPAQSQQQQQQPSPQTVHSIPAYAPAKAHATGIPHEKIAVTSEPVQQPVRTVANLQSGSGAPPGARNYGMAYKAAGTSGPVGVGSPSKIPMLVAPPYKPPPGSAGAKMSSVVGGAGQPLQDKLPPNQLPTNIPIIKPPQTQAPTAGQVFTATSRPSTIHQTSSTRIPPATPHTLSSTPQGLLKEVVTGGGGVAVVKPSVEGTVLTGEHESDPSGQSTDGDSGFDSSGRIGSVPKPCLPPKPSIPQKPTPPPRQTQSVLEKMRSSGSLESSPEALDSPLCVQHGSGASSGGLQSTSPRYASKNVIASTYTRKVNNGVLDQYVKNVNQLYGQVEQQQQQETPDEPETAAVNETSSSQPSQQMLEGNSSSYPPKRSNSQSELPIKPKPLTIKKQTGVLPPKLKGSVTSAIMATTTNVGPSGGTTGPGIGRKLSSDSGTNAVNLRAKNVISAVPSTPAALAGGATIGTTTAGSNSNRKIEIPAAFLYPTETEPTTDLNSNSEQDAVDDAGMQPSRGPPGNNNSNLLAPNLDNNARNRDVSAGGNNNAAVGDGSAWLELRDKRRPLVEGVSTHLLDNSGGGNNNNNYNLSEVVTISHSGEMDSCGGGGNEDLIASVAQRQVPLGGADDEGDCDELDVVTKMDNVNEDTPLSPSVAITRRVKKGNLKSKTSAKTTRRVSFDPLALLLDAALEGELELVKKTAQEVPNPSAANDEGITALHNAICAGHYEIVKFLVEFGCNVNAQDSDGWTPLHCAASCNNLPMVKFLVEHGACIFATTLSDHETAAEKCEEDEEGFDGCTEYLYSIQEKLGILNGGVVYALYDYDAQTTDELTFRDQDVIVVLRKGDEFEREWWWSKVKDREGYIPRNLLGLHPRVRPFPDQ